MSPRTAREALLPATQKICGEHLPSTLDDWIDEVHLTVQFERACLNGKARATLSLVRRSCR
jgi:hypothetical protein